MKMRKKGALPLAGALMAAVLALMLVLPGVSGASQESPHHPSASLAGTSDKASLHDAMRKLWEEHVAWTRMFIVSFAGGLPDLGATTDRLLQNQVDIGNAIKPYYGTAAGDQLTSLLTQHILTAAALLTAAKNGDATAFDQAKADWYANADQIAAFLHGANPKNWSLESLQMMMKRHLDMTLVEASDQLQGNYAGSIAEYDGIESEILHMANMLSKGIVRQFPGMFA